MKPIRERGSSRKFTIFATYQEICGLVGPPNVTDLDDPDKVKASWGFMDDATERKGFIWCYRVSNPWTCEMWSADGDVSLLHELFGDDLGLGRFVE
jgi:hypothetical protein